MKKTLLLAFTMLLGIMSFSQTSTQPYYLMHDYRKVSDKDLTIMLENEEHFWSKVAQLLIKEGKYYFPIYRVQKDLKKDKKIKL